MKFSINKSEFHQAIQNIIGVIPVKTTVPILSNVLLDLQDNKLTLTGTDLEVSISTNIDVRGEEDGAVAIPAKVLNEIVRELPDIPLERGPRATSRSSRSRRAGGRRSRRPRSSRPPR